MSLIRKIAKYLAYIYAITCFTQAIALKIPIGGLNIAFNYFVYIFFAVLLIANIAINKGKYKIKDSFTKAISVMLIWQFVNLPMGIANGISNWLLLTRLIFIFFVSGYVINTFVLSMEDMKKEVFLLYVGMTIQMGLGLIENITGVYGWTSYKDRFETIAWYMAKRYPCAMQENPNDFACLMFFLLGLSLVYFKNVKNIVLKICSMIVLLVSGYLIVISDSRGVLLGVVVAVGHYVVSNAKKGVSRKTLILISLCIIIVAVLGIREWESIIGFFNQKLDFSIEYGSEQTRLDYWKVALQGFVHTFGIGTGAHAGNTHCFWLELLSECGIIVFVFFISFGLDLYKKLTLCIMDKELDAEIIFAAKVIRSMIIGAIIVFISPASLLNIYWIGFLIGNLALFSKLATQKLK